VYGKSETARDHSKEWQHDSNLKDALSHGALVVGRHQVGALLGELRRLMRKRMLLLRMGSLVTMSMYQQQAGDQCRPPTKPAIQSREVR